VRARVSRPCVALAALGLSVSLLATGVTPAFADTPITASKLIPSARRVIPLPAGTWTFGETFGTAGPMWSSGHHTGQDFGAGVGVPVLAAADGVVIFTGNGGPYGNLTEIQHPDGVQSWYAHQSKIKVKTGQHVLAGQVIGAVGATGNVTGPHLHFEIRVGGQPTDPNPWLGGASAVAATNSAPIGDAAAADELRGKLTEAEDGAAAAANFAVGERAKAAKITKKLAIANKQEQAARGVLARYVRSVYKAGVDPEFLLQADAITNSDLAGYTDREVLLSYSTASQNQAVIAALKSVSHTESLRKQVTALVTSADEAVAKAKLQMAGLQAQLDAAALWLSTTSFNGQIPAGGSPQALAAVQFALSQVGHPYTHAGGTGPAYGCNGFAWRAWHEAGSNWPLQMANQQALNSQWVVPVPAGQEQPGDLIFFRFNNGTDLPGRIDHVGMVVNPGTGAFVHAASERTGVEVNNYKTTSYYRQPAMFGRMIVPKSDAQKVAEAKATKAKAKFEAKVKADALAAQKTARQAAKKAAREAAKKAAKPSASPSPSAT